MDQKPLHSVLVKPAGADCNMACAYCFYRDKNDLYPKRENPRMSEEVLAALIKQVMSQPEQEISIGWQGGEPTLMGLPFFSKAVDLEKRYGNGKIVGNGLQTNGLLLDKKWATFFTEYNFLIGLSLDGPEHIHDHYRRMSGGKGSWTKVRDQAMLMLDEGVAVNALSVVTDYSARFPDEIYGFLKESGLTYMQFIPCVETDPNNPGQGASFSATAEQYGFFLNRIFDLWRADFVNGRPTTSIRYFESLMYAYAALSPPDCTLGKECGSYTVVEHTGDVYSCDFFVEPRWKLGNIMETDLLSLLNSPRQRAFGKLKSEYPETCRACEWLEKCQGGCVKDRIRDPRDGGLNHFCAGFKRFLAHADIHFRRLIAAHRSQQEAMERTALFPQGKPGRNTSCPCGSGRKFKKCCGKFV